MKYSFITKSKESLEKMLNQTNKYLEKDDCHEIRAIQENITNTINALNIYRERKPLKVDILNSIYLEYKNELDMMFSDLKFNETQFSGEIKINEFNAPRNYRTYTNIFNKYTHKYDIGFSTFKKIYFFSDICTFTLALPKNINKEDFMERLYLLRDNMPSLIKDAMKECVQYENNLRRKQGAFR